MVAVAGGRFTRASNCKALTGKILIFWIARWSLILWEWPLKTGGRTSWMFDFLFHFISTCFSLNDLRCKLLLMQFKNFFHVFLSFSFFIFQYAVHAFEILKSLQ